MRTYTLRTKDGDCLGEFEFKESAILHAKANIDCAYVEQEDIYEDTGRCFASEIVWKKEIKIENVKLIIDMLHNVARVCNELDEHTYRLYELAMFIVSRYGDLDSLSYEQNTEITSEHLQKISDILAEHETFFDENMLLDIEDLFLEED